MNFNRLLAEFRAYTAACYIHAVVLCTNVLDVTNFTKKFLVIILKALISGYGFSAKNISV